MRCVVEGALNARPARSDAKSGYLRDLPYLSPIKIEIECRAA